MRIAKESLLICSLCALLCSACGPDLRPLEVGLGAASSVGHAAVLALAAMQGDPSPCADVTVPCDTYPCEGEVVLTLSERCPLPLGGEGVGSITVTGTWSSETAASLTAELDDVSIADRSLVAVRVSSFEVTLSDEIVRAEFSGDDVDVFGGVQLVATSDWDVTVDTAGTLADVSDDTQVIDGDDQSVGLLDVTTLDVDGAVLSPDCRRNPIAGSASLTEVSAARISNLDISFHAACDGEAEYDGTGRSGTAELDFLE